MEQIIENYGCKHYKRKCKFVSYCCEKIFNCRLCHDEYYENEKVPHKINRHLIKELICSNCDEKQEISNKCINCDTKFGEYYCNICNLFDDDTSKKQFHCEKCGICRVGGKENFFHCDICSSCINISLKDSHNCIKNSFHNTCPICCENIFESIKNITILDCGHTIHVECFSEMLKEGTLSSLRCPYCNKSCLSKEVRDTIFSQIESQIENTPMPEDLNYDVDIFCNDCLNNSKAKFHIIGHKCQECGSFNTRKI